jgi:hypothetical protein
MRDGDRRWRRFPAASSHNSESYADSDHHWVLLKKRAAESNHSSARFSSSRPADQPGHWRSAAGFVGATATTVVNALDERSIPSSSTTSH